ncbi:MAG: sulfatase-like hydrolase/transferase [Burkholderiaceae bacterium]|nr:sulfatase-like hydrolase/transferase [Burkholderiaceae bacterium]
MWRYKHAGHDAVLAAIYATALMAVMFIKQQVLGDGGYRIASRMLGHEPDAMGWLWHAHFHALDILLMVVAIPAVLLAVGWLAGRKVLSRVVLQVSLALTVLSFANLNALGATGKFLSADQFAPMVLWVMERPSSIFEYVSPSALAKLAVLLVLTIGLYRIRHAHWVERAGAAMVLVGVAVAGAAVLALAAMRFDPHPRTVFHTPVLVQMAQNLVVTGAFDAVAQHGDEPVQSLTYACEANGAKSNTGLKRPNVLMFVMETVPYELYMAGRDRLPAMAALEQSAYVGEQHFTTYPFTAYARFSIFTGLYPSYRLEKNLPLGQTRPYKSGFAALAADGYDFQVFDPVRKRYPIDDWVVQQVGGKVVGPDQDRTVAEQDQALLRNLREAIAGSARQGQPFLYTYLPQLSHGPWLPPGASKAMLYADGITRLQALDRSLAAIVEQLKQSGVYDNTVIIVTADHGLRTKKEADFLEPMVLNEVAYHVPMIMHDPGLHKTVRLSQVSSHVDLSPTVHCLYGLERTEIETQGVAWSAVPVPRPVYLGGDWYQGSGGMWDQGTYYSYNRQLDMLWKSAQFKFDPGRPLASPAREQAALDRMNRPARLQERLLAH